jgi:TatD DNase family protein
MKLIDTHAHLYYDDIQNRFDEVLENAEKNSIEKIITIGVDIKTSEQCIELAEKYPQIYASVGVHPHDAKEADKHYLNILENFASHPKVVAIGEMGLDYHYNHSEPKIQNRIFNEQIELAKSLMLPLIIHSREANYDMYEVLKIHEYNKGVLHCFSSDLEFAQKIIELGFYLSFTGIVTFKNNISVDVVKGIDLSKIMIETDSPYLAPIPFRGKRNEPSYVKLIAEKIAEIKDISIEEVAKITTDNAYKLFGKLAN